MSRQEVYSWASLLSTLAFAVFYVAFAFGIPSVFEPFQENLIQALVILIFVDVVFQVVIELQRYKGGRIEKDERDEKIEARGFKMAYYVFFVAVVVLVGHLFTLEVVESFASEEYLELMKSITLHYLVFVLILGSGAKTLTQLVYYRRGA